MPPLKRVDHIVAHILLEHVLLRPSMAVVCNFSQNLFRSYGTNYFMSNFD